MATPINSADILYQHLSVNGDGTGDFDAIGDYSGAATEFYIQPASDKIFAIETVTVSIQDGQKVSADKYGGMTALTNGIDICIEDSGGVITNITANDQIKSNGEWASYFDSMKAHTFGTGDELVVLYWKFADSGRSILLDGSKGEKLVFILNDDFTGLTLHRFFVQGAIGSDFQNTAGFHVG